MLRKYGTGGLTMENIKPCPICNSNVKVSGGPEEWKPTFNDPDSGGDSYHIDCKCGISFCIGCVDYGKFVKAWNRRDNDET